MTQIYSLGVMTGTSCDAADFALLKIARQAGGWSESLDRKASAAFPAALRRRLRSAQLGTLSIKETAELTRDYSRWLGAHCSRLIRLWKPSRPRTLVAVHGQTVWHDPGRSISVQLLDPSVIGVATGCTVVAAFRAPDLARGGQGAPLVPYYHWLRARSSEFARSMPFAIHNVGGIANLTYVTRNPGAIVAFDTGPGNALIDLAAERATHGRSHVDHDGRMASRAMGSVDWPRVRQLGRHPYFRRRPPKSTGRELFDERFLARLPGRGDALVANATALTAHTMAKAYGDFVPRGGRTLSAVYVAGGGARNPTLIRLFASELTRVTEMRIPVKPLPPSFAPAQYLEAMAFARLGFEALQGNPVSLATITGASEDAVGAGIFPGRNFASLRKLLDAGGKH